MTPPFNTALTDASQGGTPIWMAGAEIADVHSIIEAQRRRIEELELLATKDELTGLSNRRGLNSAVALENERIARGQSQGALLIMIDLNGFKAVNDQFGHEAGDTALQAVAKTLLSFIRTTDHAARVGGDEFVLLLTHTTPSQMNRRLQVLDQALNGLCFDWNGHTLSVGAAIGVTNLNGSLSITALLAEADQAMYAAKSAAKRLKDKTSKQRFVAPSHSSTSTSERITA